MSESIQAWHFCAETLQDGSPRAKPGEWETYEGEVAIRRSGLHASRRCIDALQYAPGPIIRLVECHDVEDEVRDRLVCRRRKVLAEVDATDLLRDFARWCARSVLHLWEAPEVVRRYLETGDESIRATKAATKAAARDAQNEELERLVRGAMGTGERATQEKARVMSKAFDELVELLNEHRVEFEAEMDGGEVEFWLACPAHEVPRLVELMRYASPAERLLYAAERLRTKAHGYSYKRSEYEVAADLLAAEAKREEDESDDG